jgi:hypothetical protein
MFRVPALPIMRSKIGRFSHIAEAELELSHDDVTTARFWTTFKVDVPTHSLIQRSICYTSDRQLQYRTANDGYSRYLKHVDIL